VIPNPAVLVCLGVHAVCFFRICFVVSKALVVHSHTPHIRKVVQQSIPAAETMHPLCARCCAAAPVALPPAVRALLLLACSSRSRRSAPQARMSSKEEWLTG
jgi:hypothetical protein